MGSVQYEDTENFLDSYRALVCCIIRRMKTMLIFNYRSQSYLIGSGKATIYIRFIVMEN